MMLPLTAPLGARADVPTSALVEVLEQDPGERARTMKQYLKIERIRDASDNEDHRYFADARRIVGLFVEANLEREWIRGLLLDVLDVLSRISSPSIQQPRYMCFTPVTDEEKRWLVLQRRRRRLLFDFAIAIIESYQRAGDCRLGGDLVALLGLWHNVTTASLRYLKAACRGDLKVANGAYAAVMTLPVPERASYLTEVLELVSAAQHTVGYLSPSDRIRRLWHSRIGRDLVDDEARNLEIVLEYPRAHLAAMAELFREIKWQQSFVENRRTHIQLNGMLAMLERMPSPEQRLLLAEWFIVLDEEVRAGRGDVARYARWAVLNVLRGECVPQVATWLVHRLPSYDEHADNQVGGGPLGRVCEYLAACQSTMPEIRSQVLRQATRHPGTRLSEEIERAFGPIHRDPSGAKPSPQE